MQSLISWLDYSDEERRRTLNLIDQFRESDTQDELGLGSVRDAFAELLFPGTSTIQTRARYFLFVPWLFHELERQRISSRRARTWVQNREVRLINALEAGGERGGVIGIVAREKLKRFPSSIYWHGLEVFGICRFDGSVEDYIESLDSYYKHRQDSPQTEEGTIIGRVPPNWHMSVPSAPNGLLEETTFDLTRAEAEYLRERILLNVPRSMLASLVMEERGTWADFPWDHEAYAAFPEHLREWLEHARNFSEVIQGAPLLYNLMLAEKAEREDLVDRFQADIELWGAALHSKDEALSGWGLARFWEIVSSGNSRVRSSTRSFVESWISLAVQGPNKVEPDGRARALVAQRERSLKGSQARLFNQRALELWNEGSGTGRLDYRWPAAWRIVADIVGGLRRGRDA